MESRIENIDLDEVLIDPACVMKIPAAVALRRLVLPLCVIDGFFHVAMAKADDDATLAILENETKMKLVPHIVDVMRLKSELIRAYGDGRNISSSVVSGASDDPIALADNLLRSAILRHSSDIHFDPEANSFRVRFRSDGELEDIVRLPVSIQSALTSRLKVLAGMDIAERRAPQDGAFTWQMNGGQHLPPVDVRMATLPVRHGERITLRLLESENEKLSLGRLGLSAADERIFEEVLSQPHGLVLLTGPTGSGKTTTLYAAIKSLLKRSPLNILTVEDPIEYEIEGVSQAEVDSSDKVNFSKALKSLLRHDPDVIMIGEIRDRESLDIAVKAALTGHLVLSTLHTNDAVSAVARLADMGLEAHLAAATLRLSVAQRLVRALCPKCARACAADETARALLGIEEKECPNVYMPSGCLSCAGRGYKGRLGVFELFRPDKEISSMIAKGESESEIFAVACRKGMRTLKEDLKDKCLSAFTTVSEAAKVLGGIY